VFTQTGLKKFAKGAVVSSPMFFPYANGMGLMGEEGPEGILPLKRTRSGELGVKSEGSGKMIVNNNITVQAPEGKLARESMNQLTSRLGQTINRSVRRNT
jgi:lambda family phage tail tape measure protein